MTHVETNTENSRSSFLTTMCATIVLAGGLYQPPLLPSHNHEIPDLSVGSRYPWEGKELDLPYRIEQDERNEVLEKINILHKVASQLLEYSEELEPEIAKFVDEEFWNLI